MVLKRVQPQLNRVLVMQLKVQLVVPKLQQLLLNQYQLRQNQHQIKFLIKHVDQFYKIHL